MINIKTETRATAAPEPVSSANAFSFLSRGWREVRDSADADLKLMKNRADSFKNLATSFDREIENFINSASAFSVPAIKSSPPAEIDFVKRLQPKISEIRRAYSSPDFSRKVLEKWSPRTRIRIDLSAIKNAIVADAEERDGGLGFRGWERVRRGRGLRLKEFWGEWKEESEEGQKEWEPIRALKTRLQRRSSSSDIFEGFKNSEFVEKVKSSLVCFLFLQFCFETTDLEFLLSVILLDGPLGYVFSWKLLFVGMRF